MLLWEEAENENEENKEMTEWEGPWPEDLTVDDWIVEIDDYLRAQSYTIENKVNIEDWKGIRYVYWDQLKDFLIEMKMPESVIDEI